MKRRRDGDKEGRVKWEGRDGDQEERVKWEVRPRGGKERDRVKLIQEARGIRVAGERIFGSHGVRVATLQG